MKKILQLFRNAWDFILIVALLCLAHFEGEDEPEEFAREFAPKKKNA